MKKIPHLRWWIVGMLFVASMLNYVDRQVLSQLKTTIQSDLGFGDIEYGNIVNAFLIAYGIAYLVSGRLTDWLGTRASMMLFITWWSIANILHSFARSATSLGFFRVLLGLGEAGNYTVGPKVVAEWFPAKERALAIGVYTLGAAIGAAAAPPLIIFLKDQYSWQAAFVVTGAVGLLWVVPWLWLYRKPSEHPRITDEERTMVLAETHTDTDNRVPAEVAPVLTESQRWAAVLGRRDVWALTLARLITDPLWYFMLFWLVAYMQKAKGMTESQTKIVWVVFIAADVGILLGGWLSGLFIQRGQIPQSGRMLVMLGCAAVIPLSPLVNAVEGIGPMLALLMLIALVHQGWVVNLSAIVVDRVPKHLVGTAFGVVAAGSTFGGMLMNELVKRLAKADRYDYWFVVMAFLHPVAWLILWMARVHRERKEDVVDFGVVSPSKAVHA
jgi:MFS transporter, ACS family, hexuronate transporter